MEMHKQATAALRENEQEMLFLRQALQAQRIRAQLSSPKPSPEPYRSTLMTTPTANGHRGTDREIGVAACPLAPESKVTTKGKWSLEGSLQRKLKENEREIAKLKAELAQRNAG